MVGAVVLQRYMIQSLLGKGSMGTVYLARDQREPRMVVVKVIHPEVTRDPLFKQLFEQEVESLTQLRHPCVVGLLDASARERCGPCLVMEFIPGITLEDLLHRQKRLAVEHVGRLLLPICQALNAGHAHSIVHRDLKPANMMVLNAGSDRETAKVMDFGLAQINRAPHISLEKLRGSKEAFTCGTPVYMAPESTRGDSVDHRADIYSLGVLLFEMLTGKPPFYFEDVEAILKAHVSTAPPRFAQVLPGHSISPRVESVVHHCLAKYPNERPQSAQEVAKRFFEALGKGLPDNGLWQSQSNSQPAAAKPSAVDQALTNHPNALVERFDAWMPEPIAVVKLRGFVEDVGGRILDSQPGKIRVQLGEEARSAKTELSDSTLMRWLSGGKSSERRLVPIDEEPIDLLLYMERGNSALKSTLNITVVMKPMHANPLIAGTKWKQRCEKFMTELRAHLIAK
ncbi:MAG TPA: serine/threonine-protein kinase [Gemmataceae bacterium]|nr:serine/threonine-protein kinase [Gemmataceae bacterium]